MSVIGFTFGSFGDVLSILKIAYDVRALLSESKGASEEYQQLLAELDASLRTLHLVQGVFLAKDAASLPPDVQMAIQQSVSNSRTLILDLYVKIARFRSSLQKGGSGSMMRDSWRKIGWGLFKQDELIESRRRLSEQTNIIRSLLGLSNSYVCPLVGLYGSHRLTDSLPPESLLLGWTTRSAHLMQRSLRSAVASKEFLRFLGTRGKVASTPTAVLYHY